MSVDISRIHFSMRCTDFHFYFPCVIDFKVWFRIREGKVYVNDLILKCIDVVQMILTLRRKPLNWIKPDNSDTDHSLSFANWHTTFSHIFCLWYLHGCMFVGFFFWGFNQFFEDLRTCPQLKYKFIITHLHSSEFELTNLQKVPWWTAYEISVHYTKLQYLAPIVPSHIGDATT